MSALIPKVFRVFCLVGAMCGISAWQDINAAGRAYAIPAALFLTWAGLYLFKDDPNAERLRSPRLSGDKQDALVGNSGCGQ